MTKDRFDQEAADWDNNPVTVESSKKAFAQLKECGLLRDSSGCMLHADSDDRGSWPCTFRIELNVLTLPSSFLRCVGNRLWHGPSDGTRGT